MNKLYDRRNVSADDILNMPMSHAYAIERKIKEDLYNYER